MDDRLAAIEPVDVVPEDCRTIECMVGLVSRRVDRQIVGR